MILVTTVRQCVNFEGLHINIEIKFCVFIKIAHASSAALSYSDLKHLRKSKL
jgi:hypothetical protein